MAFRSYMAFVSSTSDLTAERAKVKEGLESELLNHKFYPYLSESDASAGGPPESRLSQKIRSSEIFFLILGGRYGSIYPKKKPPEESIVQWELRRACRLFGPYIFAFIKSDLGDDVDPRQRCFIDKVTGLKSSTWVQGFQDPDSLKNRVIKSANAWLESSVNLMAVITRILLGVTCVTVGLIAALLVQRYSLSWPAYVATASLLIFVYIITHLILAKHGA